MPVTIISMFDEEEHRLPSKELLANVKTITSSGGNVTVKMANNIQKYFSNAKFYSMHGLTEAFRSTYLDPTQINIRPESIGKAIPNVEVLVLREDGTRCMPGEPGELVHRGALVSMGYWLAWPYPISR